MTTWYLDHENGNDANSGLTAWANAKRTAGAISTLAAGDTIKVAKTATADDFTLPQTYTIAANSNKATGSATLNCKIITTTFASWVAANSATVTTNSSNGLSVPDQFGASPSPVGGQLTFPASPAANTLYGSKSFTSVDLSAYSVLGIWIGLSNPSLAWTDTMIKICLCSDTAGATVVDECLVTLTVGRPQNGNTTGGWHYLTRTGGGNFGAAIQSIAVYSGSSAPLASGVIYVATPTGFTSTQDLRGGDWVRDASTNFIGKVTYIQGGETATPSVFFEYLSGNQRRQCRYAITSGTLTRIRPYLVPFKDKTTAFSSFGATSPMKLNANGTSGSHVTVSGGWNTGTDTVDGRTFWDFGGWGSSYGGWCFDSGVSSNGLSYIDFSKIWIANLRIPPCASWNNTPYGNNTYTDCAILTCNYALIYTGGSSTVWTSTNTIFALNAGMTNTSFSGTLSISYVNCFLLGEVVTQSTVPTLSFSGTRIVNSAIDFSNSSAVANCVTFTNCTPLVSTFTCGNAAPCTDAFVFTNSGATDCKLTVTPPASVTGFSETDTSTTYASPCLASSTSSTNIAQAALLKSCSFNTFSTSWSLSLVHFDTCTITFAGTSTPSVSFTNCFAEDTSFVDANAGKPTIQFTGNWGRAYRCTFDGLNQVTAVPAATAMHEESPFRFVDCVYTNTNASISHAIYPGNLVVNCQMDKPPNNTVDTYMSQSAYCDRSAFRMFNYQRTAGDHRVWFRGGVITTETTTVHTAGGKSWKIRVGIVSQGYCLEDAFIFPVGRVALKGGLTLTASIWVYTPLVGGICFKAGSDQFEFSGAQPELRAANTTTGAWEKLTLTYSPVIDGAMEFYVTLNIPTTGTPNVDFYIDDVNFAQAA